MTEVFITDIQNEMQAEKLSGILQNENTGLKINFDHNETESLFPCGHTVLRVEGNNLRPDKILSTINGLGFVGTVPEDKF